MALTSTNNLWSSYSPIFVDRATDSWLFSFPAIYCVLGLYP